MALFLCPLCHAHFYGGRAGQPSGWPVASYAGSPTLHVRHPYRNDGVAPRADEVAMEQGKQLSAIQARAVMQLIDVALVRKQVRLELSKTNIPNARRRYRQALRGINRAFNDAVIDVVQSGVNDLAMIGGLGFFTRGVA